MLVALGIGYFAAAFSLSLAVTRGNPAVALRLFPANAEAKAVAAEMLIGSQTTPADWARARQLAVSSLVRSPASPRAARILALAHLAQGRQRSADALMQLSRSLSRRDFPTTLYMIERAVAESRPQEALKNYDLALRTTPSSYDMLFPILANAVADDGLFRDFESLAAANPPWFPAFVASATYLPPPITNVTKLLMRYPSSPAAKSNDVRRVVVARLARDGDYERAFAYYRSLGKDGATLVRDERIAAASFLPPFEWTFQSQEDFGGEPASGGGLHFWASTGTSGEAASQLLMLQPGRYVLTSEAELQFSPTDGRAEWSLSCVSGNAAKLAVVRFRPSGSGKNNARTDFDVPAGCRTQKLALIIAADVNAQGIEGRVIRVAIRSAAAAQANERIAMSGAAR